MSASDEPLVLSDLPLQSGQRDERYAFHCAVGDNSGASGEFIITGHAHLIDHSELRAPIVRLDARHAQHASE
jgi:hypothetical protein